LWLIHSSAQSESGLTRSFHQDYQKGHTAMFP